MSDPKQNSASVVFRCRSVRLPTLHFWKFPRLAYPAHVEVPLSEIVADPERFVASQDEASAEIVVVCRLGNDSQIAAAALRDAGTGKQVRDLIGGLRAWSREVDPTFPVY
jgi:rhodanese-related sulfurtransferase